MITDILDLVTLALTGVADQLFQAFGQPLLITLRVLGLISLALMTLDTIMRFGILPVYSYVRWFIIYVLIFLFVESWTQFSAISTVITELPDKIAGQFLTLSSVHNEFSASSGAGSPVTEGLSAGLDAILSGILDYANYMSNTGGTSDISLALLSLLLYALSIAFGSVAIVVLSAAHVGLAFSVAVAPFFLVLLLFHTTRGIFLSWVRMTLSFSLIPLVFSGLIILPASVTLDILKKIDFSSSVVTLGDALPFCITSMGIILAMVQVPKLSFFLASQVELSFQKIISSHSR